MEERIEKTISQYYKEEVPTIGEVKVLDNSDTVLCLRWREGDVTRTIKSLLIDGQELISEIK
jgi:hypothetical protein